jgi:hypothetical protein
MADVANINNTGLSGTYALANSVDASGTTYGTAVVGQNGNAFSGTFDGLGHGVSNLTITGGNSAVGLFGVSSGVLRNIGVVNANVSGGTDVGGLAGQNNGSISNAYATGAVVGIGNRVGGLVGYQSGSGSISNA